MERSLFIINRKSIIHQMILSTDLWIWTGFLLYIYYAVIISYYVNI